MSYCAFCGTQVVSGIVACPRCGNAAGGDRQPAAPAVPAVPAGVDKGPSSKLTLLLFLIVGGFIAFFFIPNFVDALQKAKQKRPVADLHSQEAAMAPSSMDDAGSLPARKAVFEPADVPEYEELSPETTTADWIIEFEDGFLSPPSASPEQRR